MTAAHLQDSGIPGKPGLEHKEDYNICRDDNYRISDDDDETNYFSTSFRYVY